MITFDDRELCYYQQQAHACLLQAIPQVIISSCKQRNKGKYEKKLYITTKQLLL